MEMIEDYREKLLVFTKEKIKLVGGYLKKFRDTDWKKQFQDLLLRVRESGERLFKLVGENVDLAFKRAFRDVAEKKSQGIAILILSGFFLWQFGVGAGMNWLLFLAFLLYGWENRILAGAALIYLASCPFLLSLGKDALAEGMAVQAYFLLVMTVVLQIVEYKRESKVAQGRMIIRPYLEKFLRKGLIAIRPYIEKLKGEFKDRDKNNFSPLLAGPRQGGGNLSIFKLFKNHKIKNWFSNKLSVRTLNILKKYQNEWIFLGLAVLILWQMLLPGYILTLDAVFTPEMTVTKSPDGFLNSLPLNYLIHFLSLIFSAWFTEKIFLLALFFSIGYLAFRFLPVGKNQWARWFATLVYLVNPFVYTRFLAGHWFHLLAYALLPWLINQLFVFQRKNDKKSVLQLFGVLFLISICSLHFFTMSVVLVLGWLSFSGLQKLWLKQKKSLESWLENVILGGVLFLFASLYWIIPAMHRVSPIEERFDATHLEAFAAGGYGKLDPLLNLLSLNGFWGERNFWAKGFLWPQDYLLFWVAFVFLFFLVGLGVWRGVRKEKLRFKTLTFLLIGLLALVFSSGAGKTVFGEFNLWLYEHIPFWNGFRDSQKFSGFLALSYATLGGIGFSRFASLLKKKRPELHNFFLSLSLLVPFFLGFLLWGGFQSQLKPVWYPTSWFEAKSLIQKDGGQAKTLFLPWHGYMSFPWNDNLIIATPFTNFFGKNAVVSRSVEIQGLYDQESELKYEDLDAVIRKETSSDKIIDFLKRENIRYIIHFSNLKENDKLGYGFLAASRLKTLQENADLRIFEIDR